MASTAAFCRCMALVVALVATAIPSAETTPSRALPAQPCGTHCGVERWKVKTLTDPNHAQVNFTAKATSVFWLVRRDTPSQLPEEDRLAPIETQVFSVKARLVGFKKEDDRDIHIVLADLDNPAETMVVEIPDSACEGVCSSDHRDEMIQARQSFVDHCGEPLQRFKTLWESLTVDVTGVGFFDRLHGQTGVAGNGVELHPVLEIEFPTDTDECASIAH